ncbi:RodZ domain-containing protein [Nisaea sp.]|uniref:RodZ domain-containing protein n=1 Tax=Nisaea sp. TaxID=2024842 RepID=UPI003B51B038
MSTKAKLRLRHIEDADKSKAVSVTPEPVAPKLVASKPLVSDDSRIKALNSDFEPMAEGEPGSAVGMLLRRGRMERDLTLRDVSQQLRIQLSYLEALETGDFDNLPGLTYAIGYVRSYSQLVGLDAEKLITEFKAEAKKLQEPTQLTFPSPAPEGKVPGGALMFVGVLLAALSYGGWYYFSTSETTVSDLTPTIPDRLAFLLEEPAINAPEPMTETTPDTTRTTRLPDTTPPAGVKTAEMPAEQPQVAAVPEPAAPSATEATEAETRAVTAAANEPVRVETPETPTPAIDNGAAATDGTTQAASAAPAAPVGVKTENQPSVPVADPVTDTAAAVETAAPAEPEVNAPTELASAPAAASAAPASDIPAVPEVSRSTSQSAVDAEAAAIVSKPEPVPAASNEGPRIVISATDDSWVQVRGEDAAPLLTRILRKGEAYEVPVRNGLKLFTGNAGALKISINGAEAPSLGPFGKIARNIPLDESLLSYTASD